MNYKKTVFALVVFVTLAERVAFAAGEAYSAADCNKSCSAGQTCKKVSEPGVPEKYRCV